MSPLELQEVIDQIHAVGPTRVIVDDQGTAMSPTYAAHCGHDIAIAVVFIRADGWSLGAAAELEDAARSIWPESWVAVLRGFLLELENPR